MGCWHGWRFWGCTIVDRMEAEGRNKGRWSTHGSTIGKALRADTADALLAELPCCRRSPLAPSPQGCSRLTNPRLAQSLPRLAALRHLDLSNCLNLQVGDRG